MKTQRVKFPNACSRWGASMGRIAISPVNPTEKCRVFKVDIDSQGYDSGGAYWGHGKTLFCLWSNETQAFTRANSRMEAKGIFHQQFPLIKFVN